MAIYLATQPVFSVNVPDFKLFASAIFSGIEAVGLQQTDDTGQLPPESVTALSTVNDQELWPCNRMYAMTDALQAVAPIFLKVEISTIRTNNNYFPMRRFTIGSATDGNNNIVGNSISMTCVAQRYSSTGWNASNPLSPSYYCSNHTAGFVGIVAGVGLGGATNAVSSAAVLFIARTTDDSGVATPDGVTMIVGSDYGKSQTGGVAGYTNPFTGMHLDFTDGAGPLCPNVFPRVGGVTPVVSGTDVIEPQRCYIQTGKGLKPVYALMSLWVNYPLAGSEFMCANGSVFERNYVALGWELGAVVTSGYTINNSFQIAMLFE